MREQLNMIWEFLLDKELFTEQELQLVTDINGYSYETLDDICFARFGDHLEDICEQYEEYIL